MNTFTATATPVVKLALHTPAPDEGSDAPESAYLEIDARQARAIIDLTVLTSCFREEASRAGFLSAHFSVVAGIGELIPDFRLVRIPFADDSQLGPDRPVVRLPDDFSPDAIRADDECRVECHRIEIGHGHVRFTALAKHGDQRFTTADLDLPLLQRIAEERDDQLPRATLTADNSRE